MAILVSSDIIDDFEEKLPPILAYPSASGSHAYAIVTSGDEHTMKMKIYFFNTCYEVKCRDHLPKSEFLKFCEKIIKETKAFWKTYFTLDFEIAYIHDGSIPSLLENEVIINVINTKGRSFVGGRVGVYYCVGIRTSTIQHEFGHFTGLGDRYNYFLTYNMLKKEIMNGANVSFIELKTVGSGIQHFEEDEEYLIEYNWLRNLYSLGTSFMEAGFRTTTTDTTINYNAKLITKRQKEIIVTKTVENVTGSQLFFVFPSRKNSTTLIDRHPTFKLSFVGTLDGTSIVSDIFHNTKTGIAKDRMLKTSSSNLKDRVNICFNTNEPFDRGGGILADIADFYIKAFGNAKSAVRIFFLSLIKYSDKEKYNKLLKIKKENTLYLKKMCNRYFIPVYEDYEDVFKEFNLMNDFNSFKGQEASRSEIFIGALSYLNLFKDYNSPSSGVTIDNNLIIREPVDIGSNTYYQNDAEAEEVWNIAVKLPFANGLSKNNFRFFKNRLRILWLEHTAKLNTQPGSDYQNHCEKICYGARLMEIIVQLKSS